MGTLPVPVFSRARRGSLRRVCRPVHSIPPRNFWRKEIYFRLILRLGDLSITYFYPSCLCGVHTLSFRSVLQNFPKPKFSEKRLFTISRNSADFRGRATFPRVSILPWKSGVQQANQVGCLVDTVWSRNPWTGSRLGFPVRPLHCPCAVVYNRGIHTTREF